MKCEKCGATLERYYHDDGDHFGAGTAPGSEWRTRPCKCAISLRDTPKLKFPLNGDVMVFVRPTENPVISARAGNIRISYGDKWVDFKSGCVVISDDSGNEVFETRAYKE